MLFLTLKVLPSTLPKGRGLRFTFNKFKQNKDIYIMGKFKLSHNDKNFELPGFLSPEVQEGTECKDVKTVDWKTKGYRCPWDIISYCWYCIHPTSLMGIDKEGREIRKCGNCHHLIRFPKNPDKE